MRGKTITRRFAGGTLMVVALGALSLSERPAYAQCTSAPLTIQVNTTGTYTNTCAVDPVTNRWNVSVTINGPVSSNSSVTIRGANTLMLGKVTIQNNSAIDCRVFILGSGFDQRIGGVGFIDKGTSGSDKVLLLQLLTTGDVGYDRPGNWAIHTDSIANVSVGGNVLGGLLSDAYGRTLTNVYIQGDLRGGVSVGPFSSIHSLWVGGQLGMPDTDPVRVDVSGNILNLTAGAVNADITTLENGAAGTVHSFETTTGPFKGSLRAHRLGAMVDGAGPAKFQVGGHLDASLTITRDIRAPFSVAGSFRAERTVGGAGVPNVITTGTGLFDDPAAPPASNMIVQSDFAGSMVLGVPLSAGLASINRDVTIGGSLTGSISTQQDIDANINVASTFAGRIDVAGSLRSGRWIQTSGPLSGILAVGASMFGGLSVPAGGLQGQVIVNASNVGGTWTGPVTVGGTNMFSPIPTYATKSSTFGGGAVGLAPFRAHLDDCTPTHNTLGPGGFAAVSAFSNPANTPVTFRTYGPVQAAPGFTLPQALMVEQQVGASWVDRSAYFIMQFLPPGVSGRQITLRSSGAGSPPAGQYRMRPVALQSSGVSGAPNLISSTPFLFRIDTDCDNNGVGDLAQISGNPALDGDQNGQLDSCQGSPQPACPCDFNQSHMLSVQDVFDFLAAYFTASPLADFNLSGAVTIQDIFDFLNCYFVRPSGC